MRLRLARKIMKRPHRYSEGKLGAACDRYERCKASKDSEEYWNGLMETLGRDGRQAVGEAIGRRLDLAEKLQQRDEEDCLGTVYAWQCWCFRCASNIIGEYDDNPSHLPLSVILRVQDAEDAILAATK